MRGLILALTLALSLAPALPATAMPAQAALILPVFEPSAPLGPVANCFATADDGATIFASVDAAAAQKAVDVALTGTVKIAGVCAGTQARDSGLQSVYVSSTLVLRGGYAPDNWALSAPITQPSTLDALGGGRVLRAVGAELTVMNVIVQNGSDPGSGGGIDSDSALTLSNVSVLSGTALLGGGAHTSATLALIDARFENNTAGDSGGGVYADGALAIAASIFISNAAQVGGGGGFGLGDTVLSGGRFERNQAGVEGGGLFSEGTLAMSGTLFLSNTAGSEAGGAGAFGHATIEGGLFQANTTGLEGGGFLAETTLAITGTRFVSNTARTGGGAFAELSATATDAVFEDNFANFGGGLGSEEHVVISGSSFLSNTAVSEGGGVATDGAVTAIGSLFQGNRALVRGGGGVYSADLLTLTDTQLIGNAAQRSGGGAYAFSGASLSGVLFAGNQALALQGGGLYASGASILKDVQFISNTALEAGGGAMARAETHIEGGLFDANGAGAGGGLFANSVLAITGTRFIANLAAGNGGGLAQVNGAATFVNALFARNTASSGQGGALSFEAAGSKDIAHTTIASPTLAAGSAIYVGAGELSVRNSILTSHTTGIDNAGGSASESHTVYFGNGADMSGTVASGGGSLVGDPAFANAGANDYRLGIASVAVDQGAPLGVDLDAFGAARPQGRAPDPGYHESVYFAPSLTLTKVVAGPAPIAAWIFSGPTGTLSLPTGGGAFSWPILLSTTYALSETAVAGYATTVACSTGATGSSSVSVGLMNTVSPGVSASCVFTNTWTPTVAVFIPVVAR